MAYHILFLEITEKAKIYREKSTGFYDDGTEDTIARKQHNVWH